MPTPIKQDYTGFSGFIPRGDKALSCLYSLFFLLSAGYVYYALKK
jgi:hypothetical protein